MVSENVAKATPNSINATGASFCPSVIAMAVATRQRRLEKAIAMMLLRLGTMKMVLPRR